MGKPDLQAPSKRVRIVLCSAVVAVAAALPTAGLAADWSSKLAKPTADWSSAIAKPKADWSSGKRPTADWSSRFKSSQLR